MESDINNKQDFLKKIHTFKRDSKSNDNFSKQLDIIKKASELAQSKIDYIASHDDNIIKAIEIVESFLRRKHRICYGGQAINAYLPTKYKIYNPELTIPDYDFFTPQQNEDIITLVNDLKKAGFAEISVREGIHEGTIKMYVNYIAIADITSINSTIYRTLSKRELKVDGISYLDANSLRMLMYLELSRPRGEVSRWTKVFERLLLFNEFVPVKHCKLDRNMFNGCITLPQTKCVINYIIENKLIFAGADLLSYYENPVKYKYKYKHNKWVLSTNKPIVFFSPDSETDSKKLRQELLTLNKLTQPKSSSKSLLIKSYESKDNDFIPNMKVITKQNKPLVFIIQQNGCSSYFNISTTGDKLLRIATMDTLINLYFSLGLHNSKFYNMGSMECLANHLVQINMNARKNHDKYAFPFISIECAGHQTTLPSLIRSKIKRITEKKKEIVSILHNTSGHRSTRRTIKQRR
jgi:hypothetical protein